MMSKRCKNCCLFETDACCYQFYTRENDLPCRQFIDVNELPNKYFEKIYQIGYNRGKEDTIAELTNQKEN